MQTKEQVLSKIRARGFEILDDFEYVSHKYTFRCQHGHTWKTTAHSVIRGSGCPTCAGVKPLTKVDICERLLGSGIELVGDYVTSNHNSLFRCSCGYEWTSTTNVVCKSRLCPSCSGQLIYTDGTVQRAIENRGIRVLTPITKSLGIVRFGCSCGYEWETTADSVYRGTGCLVCSGNNKYTKDEINDLIRDKGIVILDEPSGIRKKYNFKCSKDHVFNTVASNVMFHSGCPKCAKYGFNQNRRGRFYIVRNPILDVCKFGVTNTDQSRLQQHAKCGFSEKVLFLDFDSGADCLELERLIHREFNTGVIGREHISSGWTETISCSDMDAVVNLATDFHRNRAKRENITCVETGVVFTRRFDLKNWLHSIGITKVNTGNIDRSMNTGCRAYGYHWRYAEPVDTQQDKDV